MTLTYPPLIIPPIGAFGLTAPGWGIGSASESEECEPELWLSERDARTVDITTEQVLGQMNGFSLILLHAEMKDEEDEEPGYSAPIWR